LGLDQAQEAQASGIGQHLQGSGQMLGLVLGDGPLEERRATPGDDGQRDHAASLPDRFETSIAVYVLA
jgi:hypothetical protein